MRHLHEIAFLLGAGKNERVFLGLIFKHLVIKYTISISNIRDSKVELQEKNILYKLSCDKEWRNSVWNRKQFINTVFLLRRVTVTFIWKNFVRCLSCSRAGDTLWAVAAIFVISIVIFFSWFCCLCHLFVFVLPFPIFFCGRAVFDSCRFSVSLLLSAWSFRVFSLIVLNEGLHINKQILSETVIPQR